VSRAEHAGVVVRVATGDEIADAGAVTAQAYAADHLLAADDEYADELRDAATRARTATLLVAVLPGDERDGEVVVGTITLAPHGSPYAEVSHPGEHELRMLAVAPEARRHGVAEALLFAALREAVAAGTTRVVLSTLDAMHAAHRLYERLGFVAEPARDWSPGRDKLLHVQAWTPPEAPGAEREVATWPPARVVEVDGWRVGLSGGMTRRANSVLPVAAPRDLGAAVERVEALYAAERQPAVFRIGRGARPAGLAALLDARGYRVATQTDVLVRPLDELPAVPSRGEAVVAADAPNAAWLAVWSGEKAPLAARRPGPEAGVPDASPVDAGSVDAGFVDAVLTAPRALYLTAHDDAGPVGVVRAAFVDDWVGLSCLAVNGRARRRGIGRTLTLRALRAAAEQGARRAFLQVEVENTAAATLYARLGFLPAERYHYRQRR
jgi:ribosomal protein S18 acetylase RimI-like enzyme